MFYFEILRKGMSGIPGPGPQTAQNVHFAPELVSLIHYGLTGKPDRIK
ncbi:MAG: hypothetical protein JXA46_15570 [Dehalococcoidales bacterium]|nr:hypothetical protein [Dehalococcoidales bacterium]